MSKHYYKVSQELSAQTGDSELMALIAGGVYQRKFVEWYTHANNDSGTPPDDAAIAFWHEQQPPEMWAECVAEAGRAVEDFSGTVQEEVKTALEDFLNSEVEKAIHGEIITRLDNFDPRRQHLPNLGINVLGGVLAAIIATGLLGGIYFYWKSQEASVPPPPGHYESNTSSDVGASPEDISKELTGAPKN